MLVLSATYHNGSLKKLVPAERFQALLERTIKFLRRLGPISPTCAIDCSILEKIHRRLFGVTSEAKHLFSNEKHFYRDEHVQPPSATNSFSVST